MPQRIQLRRTRGWRKPASAVVVSRPGKWGNPYRVGEPDVPDAATAVAMHKHALRYAILRGDETTILSWQAANLHRLRGRDLCCWCRVGAPCHADTLLSMANRHERA